MELHTPSVLAQLPRPLQAAAGKTQIGEVHSLVSSKKRKRYEVAAAIDGESVNIYNVQAPKLATSYAVPPQSSFSCRPCSVRRKVGQTSVVRRQTYCAIERPEKQIQCFCEESSPASSSAAPSISNTVFSLKDSNSHPVFLGTIPSRHVGQDEQDTFDVVAVHNDGRVRRLSADLKAQRWTILPSAAFDSSSHSVLATFLVEFDDARKTLFKRRQDIIATIVGDSIGADLESTSILMLLTQPTESKGAKPNVFVQLFSIPAKVPQDDFRFDPAQSLRHLATMRLPELEGQDKLQFQNPQWNFHSGSATLNLAFEQGFVAYDLSQYTPEVSSQIIDNNEKFSSLLRISPRSIIGAGQSSVAIYDTQYQSIQANVSIADVSLATGIKTESKKSPIVFVSYLARLGIAIALRGNALLAFYLTMPSALQSQSLKRPRDGLLIDAIGRGMGSGGVQTGNATREKDDTIMGLKLLGLQSTKAAERWGQVSKELDALAKLKEAAKFDDVAKSALVSRKTGIASEHQKPGRLPSANDFVDPQVVSYLLSKIFALQTPQGSTKGGQIASTPSAKLTISFLPPELFNWLVSTKRLSRENIEIALRQSAWPQIISGLPSGALVKAVVDFDSSLKLLHAVLRGSVNLGADELTHALKIVLQAVCTRTAALELPQAITDGSTTEAPKAKDSEPELSGLFAALNLVLKKLHAQPADAVTRSLRNVLTSAESLLVIQHLRISLATSGYTTRFTEIPPTVPSVAREASSLPLAAVVGMLNACVDAVGPSGWISATGFPGAEDTEADVIANMKSEVSAALAGVEEATYLKGILREFIRYAGTATRVDARAAAEEERSSRNAETVKREQENGAELLVYPTGEDVEGGLDHGRLLPLSLKARTSDAADEVKRTKVQRSTGEMRTKSTREIRYQKRKAVGKYSFERIIV